MKRIKNKGFTLVELVAIVVLLAAIFLIGFPILLGITKKTNDSQFDVMVDNLCEASKAYVNGNPEKFPNLNVVGNKLVLSISDLIEYGVVDPTTKNPKTNQTLEDSSIVITVEEDQSLSCAFDPRTVTPIPNSDLICNPDLVYTGELLSLIKNRQDGVIYTNDRATNAGTYIVTASLNPNSAFVWSDTTATSKTVTCTIKKANDTITIVPVSRIYNGQELVPSIETSSGISTGKSFYSDVVCNNSTQAINVGIYYGIAHTNGNSNYNSVTSECKLMGTILPAPLTPTVTCNTSKIYDGTRNITCSLHLTGIIGSDSVTPTGTCLYDDANVGTNKQVTCTGLGLQGPSTPNYALTTTTITTTANIDNVKLTFDANGGTLSGTSPLYTRKGESSAYTGLNNSTTTSYPTATRRGYTFDGWMIGSTKVINANGTLVPSVTNYTDSNGKWLITTNQTLKAKWVAKQLTIRYNKNDGTNATSTETFTYDGNMDDNKFNPPTGYKTRTGYKFAGWSMKADGTDGIRWDFNVSVGDNWFVNQMGDATTKTVDVYAIWTANKLTVNSYANGATKNSSGQTVTELLKTETLNYDGTVGYQWPTDYADPYGFKLVRTGYKKDGYYHVGSGTSTTTIPQDLVTNTNGATVISVAQSLGVLSSLQAGDTTVNIYAGWTPNVLTVNYYANGATKDSSGNTVNELLRTETLNYDGTVGYQWPTDYADPYGFKLVRTGYTKDGKYHIGSGTSTTTIPQDLVTNTNGATVISVAQSLGALSSLESGNTTVNIYAGWTVNTYTITYNLNCNGSSSCSGKPADQTYTYAPGQSINLSSTTPTRTAFTFKGWSLDPNASNGTYSPGQAWGRQSIPSSGTVYTLYAIWESSERPTVTCSVTGTSATGTGSTREAGYLVGATVTCTCTGENAKPTSMTIDGSTVTTTSSNNGYTRSASKTISSPGAINVSATCTNEGQSQNTGSTGTKYYYRQYQLAYKINGAEKIGTSTSNYNSSVQTLMANNTWSDGGSKFTLPTVSRTSSFAYCGSACGALGWDLGSTEKTARFTSGATVNMCTTGTSGCSETTKGSSAVSSGTIGLGSSYTARNIYAISWGRIAAPRVYTATGVSGGSYFYLTGEGENLLGSGQTTTNVEVAASHRNDYAVVYNTRRYAWATIYGSCSFVTGGEMGYTNWQTQAHTSGAYLRYKVGSTEYFVTNGDETTPALATGEGNPPPLGKVPFIPYQNYTDYGWWCDTFDTSSNHGWTLTINPYGGTYTGDTTRHMLYGSRANNNIGAPTKTGYRFLGWYSLPEGDGNKIYDSSGKAIKLSSGSYWNYPESYQDYAIWVALSNVTAYAYWEEMSAKLTYYTNGIGSIPSPNPVTMKYTEATYAKSAPSATGYTFLKWCTKSDGTGTCFAATGQHESVIKLANSTSYLSSDMALYAIWQAKTYTLTFKPNSCFAQNCSSIPNLTATATYGKSLTAPHPGSSTPAGRTFLGWYDDSDRQVFKADLSPSGNTTYWSSGKWSYNGAVTLKGKWQ